MRIATIFTDFASTILVAAHPHTITSAATPQSTYMPKPSAPPGLNHTVHVNISEECLKILMKLNLVDHVPHNTTQPCEMILAAFGIDHPLAFNVTTGKLHPHPHCCKCNTCMSKPVQLNTTMANGTMTKHNCTAAHPTGCQCSHCAHPPCCKCSKCIGKPVQLTNSMMPKHNCTTAHPPGCQCTHCASNSSNTTIYTRSTNHSDHSRNSIGVAIGVAAAGFGGIVAFTLLFCWVNRRKSKAGGYPEEQEVQAKVHRKGWPSTEPRLGKPVMSFREHRAARMCRGGDVPKAWSAGGLTVIV